MNPAEELKIILDRKSQFSTPQEYQDFLDNPEKYPHIAGETRLTPQMLQQLLDRYSPGVKLADKKDPAYQERERIGRIARQSWKELLTARAFTPCNDRLKAIRPAPERSLMALVDCMDGPDSENELLFHGLTTGDPRELTEAVLRRTKWASRVMRECRGLKDGQLATRTADVVQATSVLMEAGKYLELMQNGVLAQNEELIPLLHAADAEEGFLASQVQHRLCVMANDLYPAIRPGDYMQITASLPDAELQEDESIGEDLMENATLIGLQTGIAGLQSTVMDERSAYLKDQLAPQFDNARELKLFNPRTNKKLGSLANPNIVELRPCDPIGIIAPDGQKKLLWLSGEKRDRMQAAELPMAALADLDFVSLTDELSGALQDATLFARGSQQYKDMQKALESAKKDFRTLSDPPGQDDLRRRKEKMEELLQSTNDYLTYKEEHHNDTGNERKRIRAALRLKKFAASQLRLLNSVETGGYENPRDAQEPPLQRKLNAETNQLLQQKQLMYLNAARTLKPGSPAQLLCLEAAGGLRNAHMADLLSGCDSFASFRDGSRAKRLMGQLCAADLILRERAAGSGTPGPLEQALNNGRDSDNFVNSIRSSEAYRQVIPQESPAALKRFLQENAERQVTGKILERAAGASQRKPGDKQAAPVQKSNQRVK